MAVSVHTMSYKQPTSASTMNRDLLSRSCGKTLIMDGVFFWIIELAILFTRLVSTLS